MTDILGDSRGMHYIFLPAYSPDYNPIELAFSKIKQSIRRDGEMLHTLFFGRGIEAEARILASFYKHVYSVTATDAEGWFVHCNYN